MSAFRPPRHLAPRRRLLGTRGRLLAALAAAVALVSGAVAVALVVAGPSTRGPSADRPTRGASPATTARAIPPGSRSDTTATSPAQPVRPIPGNLLANGDFEQGLSGWSAFGGARVERVAVAHSGTWSVSIGPAEGVAPARPGVVSPVGVEARRGRTYQGRAWVRASAPGTEVTLALREQAGDGQSNADVLGISLPDGEWHEVAVVHQVHVAGARLSLELTGGNLGAGDMILVDEVGVTAP
jgi:Carbohydrate binding domain